MDARRELNQKDLFALYGDYVAAHATRQVGDNFGAEGDEESADRWHRMADELLSNVIGDMDALEINVYIASRLQRDRLDIVARLRNSSSPPSWAKIGQALGQTKQTAHEWFHRGYRRPRIENPTAPVD
jgi:hypothetical protein